MPWCAYIDTEQVYVGIVDNTELGSPWVLSIPQAPTLTNLYQSSTCPESSVVLYTAPEIQALISAGGSSAPQTAQAGPEYYGAMISIFAAFLAAGSVIWGLKQVKALLTLRPES